MNIDSVTMLNEKDIPENTILNKFKVVEIEEKMIALYSTKAKNNFKSLCLKSEEEI